MSGIFLVITEFLGWATSLLGIFLALSLIRGNGQNTNVGDYVTYCLYSINIIKGVHQTFLAHFLFERRTRVNFLGLVLILKLLPRLAAILGAISQVLKMIEREPRAPEAVCCNYKQGNDNPPN